MASLSLLSECVIRFASQKSSRQKDLLLQPDSLLVIASEARHDWTHAIQGTKTYLVKVQRSQRTRRISLTFRQVKFGN
ncbi:alpha-ketoglutarate-dependent dioxygenase AlkB [Yoonia sp. R78084]|uniref:alpha-ketoglutarate-dependent dioxygenase AlkB n=1 Tax=Yoonia sp. R78084 TaxID=3093869 RepID=UPI0037DCF0C6